MNLGEKLFKGFLAFALLVILFAGTYCIYTPIHEVSHFSASLAIGSGAKGIDLYSHVEPEPINGAFNAFLFYSAPYIVGLIILLICIKLKSIIKRPWNIIPIIFAHFVYFNVVGNFFLQFISPDGNDFISVLRNAGLLYWIISSLIVVLVSLIWWENRADTKILYKNFEKIISKHSKI